MNWAKRVTVTVIALPLAVANGFLTPLAAFFTYWPGAGVGPSGPKETPEERPLWVALVLVSVGLFVLLQTLVWWGYRGSRPLAWRKAILWSMLALLSGVTLCVGVGVLGWAAGWGYSGEGLNAMLVQMFFVWQLGIVASLFVAGVSAARPGKLGDGDQACPTSSHRGVRR